MIDPKIVKDNPNLLRDMLKKRKVDFPISELLDLDRNSEFQTPEKHAITKYRE